MQLASKHSHGEKAMKFFFTIIKKQKKAKCLKQTIPLFNSNTSIILESLFYNGDTICTHIKVEWSPVCGIFYTRQLSIQDCIHCNLVMNALEE